MKKLTFILIAVLISFGVCAQAPNKMSYQAVVRDTSNNLIANQAIGIKIEMREGSVTEYSERHTVTTNINGLFSIIIGNGTLISGNWSNLDWNSNTMSIHTDIDLTGGTNYTLSATLNGNTISANTSNSRPQFYLGQDTLGGIVYYIYSDSTGSQHGLIVSKTETGSTGLQIQNNTSTNATSTFDGTLNTSQLLSTGGAMTWLTTNFSSAWYIPSVDELNLLLNARYHMNKTATAINATLLPSNGIAEYWSSTEVSSDYFIYVDFFWGRTNAGLKQYGKRVRAIRKF
jgi:hypothetical protein